MVKHEELLPVLLAISLSDGCKQGWGSLLYISSLITMQRTLLLNKWHTWKFCMHGCASSCHSHSCYATGDSSLWMDLTLGRANWPQEALIYHEMAAGHLKHTHTHILVLLVSKSLHPTIITRPFASALMPVMKTRASSRQAALHLTPFLLHGGDFRCNRSEQESLSSLISKSV